MSKKLTIILSIFLFSVVLVGCNNEQASKGDDQKAQQKNEQTDQKKNTTEEKKEEPTKVEKPKTPATQPKAPATQPKTNDDAIEVVAEPDSITVLVNKQNKLPEGHAPKDLRSVNVPFASSATVEKRQLRQEAAKALEELFNGAKEQGISLLGVSGYRSNATQTYLFNYYVENDGIEKARTYSALPGTSEHETGLAIDVTGGDGSCAVQDCFADKVEGKWLASHASEYGYIIRYPKGKETITGYKYEPWHIRYVGIEIAKEIHKRGITLEEYYNAIPVNN